MNAIEIVSCIRFIEIPQGNPDGRIYVLITNQQSGCWSYVGNLGVTYPGFQQTLNLQRFGCMVSFESLKSKIRQVDILNGKYNNRLSPFFEVPSCSGP